MSKRPVKMLAEVQLLIKDYVPIREATVELCVAFFRSSSSFLFAFFLSEVALEWG